MIDSSGINSLGSLFDDFFPLFFFFGGGFAGCWMRVLCTWLTWFTRARKGFNDWIIRSDRFGKLGRAGGMNSTHFSIENLIGKFDGCLFGLNILI